VPVISNKFVVVALKVIFLDPELALVIVPLQLVCVTTSGNKNVAHPTDMAKVSLLDNCIDPELDTRLESYGLEVTVQFPIKLSSAPA
jgi:hypothetical protein